MGSTFLVKVGIKLDDDESVIKWFGDKQCLKDPEWILSGGFSAIEDSICVQSEDEIIGEDWLDSFFVKILDASYAKADIQDVLVVRFLGLTSDLVPLSLNEMTGRCLNVLLVRCTDAK